MTIGEKREVNVRRATPGDIPSIMALERDTPGIAHWSESSYRSIFAPNSPVRIGLVAVEPGEERMRGFLFARVSARDCELENLAVAAPYRRRGIGSALLKSFLGEARALRLERIMLEVRESNQEARALYEKHGFSIDGRRRSYYREPEEDAILYTLGQSLAPAES
jgi:ribosomal-protein-alanine acetyltransferase